MALPTASDNAFPSLLITEGSAPASPAAGKRRLYVLSSDHLPYLKDSSGTVVALSGMTNPMTTKGDVILGDTSGVPSRLAAGTSTYVLTSNGAGAFPSWQAPAGGGAGALTLLEQHTASNSGSLPFTSFISGTYDDYLVEGLYLVPATNGASLVMQVGTGGGPTYDTGSNYYTFGSGAATSLAIGAVVTNAADYGHCSFSLRLADPGGAKMKGSYGTAQWHNGSTVQGGATGGLWAVVTAMTAVRFLYSSGNITSGVIRIYGIPKT